MITALAIYAAILATLSTIWQANRWLNDQARIRVEVTFGFAFGGLADDLSAMIGIRMINGGQRPIQLNGAGLDLDRGRTVPYMNPPLSMQHLEAHQFPFTLEEGTSAEVFFDVMELTKTLINDNDGNLPTHGWATDAKGETHRVRIKKAVLGNWRNEIGRRTRGA